MSEESTNNGNTALIYSHTAYTAWKVNEPAYSKARGRGDDYVTATRHVTRQTVMALLAVRVRQRWRYEAGRSRCLSYYYTTQIRGQFARAHFTWKKKQNACGKTAFTARSSGFFFSAKKVKVWPNLSAEVFFFLPTSRSTILFFFTVISTNYSAVNHPLQTRDTFVQYTPIYTTLKNINTITIYIYLYKAL